MITPNAILSYPHLFTPQLPPGKTDPKDAKYSCSLVFPKGTDMREMRAAAEAAGRAKFGDKYNGMLAAGKLKMPFRDDVEEKGYPAGSVYFNASGKTKPGPTLRRGRWQARSAHQRRGFVSGLPGPGFDQLLRVRHERQSGRCGRA